tara:strand:+ start:120 stop:416 length:297 start_codon:yes stop_codon:yes gene_type:complete
MGFQSVPIRSSGELAASGLVYGSPCTLYGMVVTSTGAPTATVYNAGVVGDAVAANAIAYATSIRYHMFPHPIECPDGLWMILDVGATAIVYYSKIAGE